LDARAVFDHFSEGKMIKISKTPILAFAAQVSEQILS